jgi:hypothetical protein
VESVLHLVLLLLPGLEGSQSLIAHHALYGYGAFFVWFGYLLVDEVVAKTYNLLTF